jgi:DNA-binding transcriptional ArsR family regulator
MKAELRTMENKILDELVKVLDSKFLKALSEPVRIEILKFIMRNGRTDIGTIAENMPQDRSVISRHLNLMHEVGILICEKVGRHRFYDIDGKVFLDRLENITDLVRKCVPMCCPSP